jgi:putative Mg2+ transporter-C (MgtC) family protein
MPLSPSVADIVIRILLTVIASAAIGLERGERGKAAGLRTTMLVALAACFAMVLGNLLLNTVGKAPNSFVNFDIMRLPLGILSGVGFIGGGAILRRKKTLLGVTTAATLWYVTVVGLCFGAGAIWVGIGASVVGVLIVQALHVLEARMRRDRRATLTITWDRSKLDRTDLERLVVKHPFRLEASSSESSVEPYEGKLELSLRWRAPGGDRTTPEIVDTLLAIDGVHFVGWRAMPGETN